MFCIVAFIVLSILGIFSASNRQLARESLGCVTRRVTLRPCNTGFDEKVKAKILGVVITRSESGARFLNRHFEFLSWIFFFLLLASSVMAVRGLYLFYVTGSCNGLNDTAFCLFDPTGENNQVSSLGPGCAVSENPEKGVTLKNVDLSAWPAQNVGASDQIVMVGCYACDYTRRAYPDIKALVEKFKVEFRFGEFQVKEKTDLLSKVGYCVYQADQEKYWQMNDLLFTTDKANLDNEAYVYKLLADLGLDTAKVSACVKDPQTLASLTKLLTEVRKTNFPGTPTIFINGEPMVGPKPYRVYAIKLKGLFYWAQ
jgi:hypothetical protein